MFETVVCGGTICPDVNGTWERGSGKAGGAREVMSGVGGERVACTRKGHTTYLVVLSEERHGGHEESNAARGVAHGGPNADGGGGRGTRRLRTEAPGSKSELIPKGGNLLNAFLAVQATGQGVKVGNISNTMGSETG